MAAACEHGETAGAPRSANQALRAARRERQQAAQQALAGRLRAALDRVLELEDEIALLRARLAAPPEISERIDLMTPVLEASHAGAPIPGPARARRNLAENHIGISASSIRRFSGPELNRAQRAGRAGCRHPDAPVPAAMAPKQGRWQELAMPQALSNDRMEDTPVLAAGAVQAVNMAPFWLSAAIAGPLGDEDVGEGDASSHGMAADLSGDPIHSSIPPDVPRVPMGSSGCGQVKDPEARIAELREAYAQLDEANANLMRDFERQCLGRADVEQRAEHLQNKMASFSRDKAELKGRVAEALRNCQQLAALLDTPKADASAQAEVRTAISSLQTDVSCQHAGGYD